MKTMPLARHTDPYPEDSIKVAAASPAASKIDEFADQAERETRRWYGQIGHFNRVFDKPMRCREWLIEHWRRFPGVSPDGGKES